MNVLKVEAPSVDLPPLYVKAVADLQEVEATLSYFLCLPGEEEFLEVGHQVTITVVEMSEEEFNALPSWEDA